MLRRNSYFLMIRGMRPLPLFRAFVIVLIIFSCLYGLSITYTSQPQRLEFTGTEASLDPLVLRVSLMRTNFSYGEQVAIKFVLENTGDLDLNLTNTTLFFDFRVLDGEEDIYQWSKHYELPQEPYSLTIRSHEGSIAMFIWNQENDLGEQVSVGSYSIVGFTTQFEYEGEWVSIQAPPIEIKIK